MPESYAAHIINKWHFVYVQVLHNVLGVAIFLIITCIYIDFPNVINRAAIRSISQISKV